MTDTDTSTGPLALPATDFSKLPTLPPVITDKRGFAARWSFSVRHIDNLLAQGMPHLAIGKRRVRIVIAEGDAWMREQFGTRRRRGAGTAATEGKVQA